MRNDILNVPNYCIPQDGSRVSRRTSGLKEWFNSPFSQNKMKSRIIFWRNVFDVINSGRVSSFCEYVPHYPKPIPPQRFWSFPHKFSFQTFSSPKSDIFSEITLFSNQLWGKSIFLMLFCTNFDAKSNICFNYSSTTHLT